MYSKFRHNPLAEFLFHAATRTPATIHYSDPGLPEHAAAPATKVVPRMLRNFDLGASRSVQQVITSVPQRAHTLAAHHITDFSVLLFLSEVLAVGRLIVLLGEHVEAASALVGVTGLVLGSLLFGLLIGTVLLVLCEFPAFQISLVPGDPPLVHRLLLLFILQISLALLNRCKVLVESVLFAAEMA